MIARRIKSVGVNSRAPHPAARSQKSFMAQGLGGPKVSVFGKHNVEPAQPGQLRLTPCGGFSAN
jgi:hypothetical protein